MADSASPKDIPELLQFMASYVRNHLEKTGRRTTGAALADAIRQRFPGFGFEQLGFSRLADAVHRAEEEGALVRHRDVQHLEVSPSEATPRTPSAHAASTMSSYVRADVWRAFVFVTDRYAHFLDRTTGRLVSLMSNDKEQVNAQERDPRFVRVESIAPDAQKDWMRQFLVSQDSLAADDAPINEEEWWIKFPTWLKEQNGEAGFAWRRFRSEKIVTFIREWAKENGILLDSLFSPPRLPTQATPRRKDRPDEDEATRRAIIEVVEKMPFEQLQDLTIPVRYMLRHFRPR